jgi:hypothetical protein
MSPDEIEKGIGAAIDRAVGVPEWLFGWVAVEWKWLARAAAAGNRPVCQWLIARGMDPAEKGEGGKSAIEIAQEKGHHGLAALLLGKTSVIDIEPVFYCRVKMPDRLD